MSGIMNRLEKGVVLGAEGYLFELERRGFPAPDPTTGRYCLEAVDRWRLRRHAKLFPELTHSPTAIDAGTVFAERMGRLSGAR